MNEQEEKRYIKNEVYKSNEKRAFPLIVYIFLDFYCDDQYKEILKYLFTCLLLA